MVCRHPFDASKWGRIQKFLADEGVLKRKRIVEPLEATRDDLLVVCYVTPFLYPFHYYVGFACKKTHFLLELVSD
ncbi:hypothetical protein M758_12G098700 [Ceratodon purpureus]|nr:hypothetical protein M758_12G098700 [Ceratodon purpureus]